MINYKLLDDSIKYYSNFGFKRIESPWTVTKEIAQITTPPNSSYFTIQEKDKVLVASGEQSFLYLYKKGFLPKGRYQTITPCFRNDNFDELHTKYFIKNELINTEFVTEYDLTEMVKTALEFFESNLNDKCQVVKIQENQYDILYNDNEIGSYGIRHCSYLSWIYGTGLAEPRFSDILSKKELWDTIKKK